MRHVYNLLKFFSTASRQRDTEGAEQGWRIPLRFESPLRRHMDSPESPDLDISDSPASLGALLTEFQRSVIDLHREFRNIWGNTQTNTLPCVNVK